MEEEREETTTTAKAKAKKRKCSYNKDWETIYPWVRPVQGESDRVFCDICQSRFSVAHGGEHDVKRHRQCDTHKKRVAQKEASKSMDTFILKKKQDSNSDKVTAAEITSVYHTVQHSQSYRSVISYPPLFAKKKKKF